MIPAEKRLPGSRSIIKVDVHKVGTVCRHQALSLSVSASLLDVPQSCGYSVPFYQFVGHRTKLLQYASRLERIDLKAAETGEAAGVAEGGLKDYWSKKNLQSIDGLPGLCEAQNSTALYKPPPEYKTDNENVSHISERSLSGRKIVPSVVDLRLLVGVLLGVIMTLALQDQVGHMYSQFGSSLPL